MSQMIEYLSTGVHPLKNTIEPIELPPNAKQRVKEVLKKRGLTGYSSLKKDQMTEYLSTGIHPLKDAQIPPQLQKVRYTIHLLAALDIHQLFLPEQSENSLSITMYQGLLTDYENFS